MKVAGAAVNLGSQELFKGVDSAVGKALVAAGTSYAGSVTAGFIGSVNWDKLGTADWINGERMKESAFGAGTIASALSAGAMAGTGAAASAKLASLGETGTAIGKFYGGAIKLGTAAAGKAVEYGTHAAYSLAQGGTLMDAYDNMGGITLNIANLGSIIDMVGSGIARNNTTAQSVLGSIAEKLGGTGLLEINIGSEGVTGRIGSGGIDVGGAVYDLAKRGIDRAALEEKLHTAEGQTAYGLYVHEDWTMENTAMRVANGKDGLLFVEQGGLGSGTRYGQTVRNGSGGRSITIADMGYADNVAVLGHEAYRDGMTPDGDYLETRQAVRAHTELADRMRNAGYSFNSEGVIGLDLAVYDYARSVGNMGIMDTYADMVYRSDGDYFDIEETLKGKISYVIGKTFQDEGIERGLLGGNLTFGGSIAELLGVFQMYIGPKLNNTPDAASNNAERVFDRWNEIETDGSNETIKEVATLDDLIKLFNSMADGGTLKPVKFDGNNMDEYLKRTTAVLSDGTEITYRRSSSASSGNLPAIDISWPKDKSYPWGEDNFKVHITYPKKGGKK
jgi:hypothetical protein